MSQQKPQRQIGTMFFEQGQRDFQIRRAEFGVREQLLRSLFRRFVRLERSVRGAGERDHVGVALQLFRQTIEVNERALRLCLRDQQNGGLIIRFGMIGLLAQDALINVEGFGCGLRIARGIFQIQATEVQRRADELRLPRERKRESLFRRSVITGLRFENAQQVIESGIGGITLAGFRQSGTCACGIVGLQAFLNLQNGLFAGGLRPGCDATQQRKNAVEPVDFFHG